MNRVKVMQAGTDDCERACVATYFGVSLEDVPDLARNDWEDVLREWLRGHDPWPDGSGIKRIDEVDVFFPLLPIDAKEVR